MVLLVAIISLIITCDFDMRGSAKKVENKISLGVFITRSFPDKYSVNIRFLKGLTLTLYHFYYRSDPTEIVYVRFCTRNKIS